MLFSWRDPNRQILRQQHTEGGRAQNSFSTQRSAGSAAPVACHRCQCETLYDEVMRRVLRVKNLCSDAGSACAVESFSAFRRRNRAISADYARIYMKTTGEAKRLKFAGGAALGSTHIGYAMDSASDVLEGWGSKAGRSEKPDLVLADGTRIVDDGNFANLLDWQELASRNLFNLGYRETLIGLRRLVYGNLAIYMDLGAVLHFCQMHEERFHFFRDGKVEEFIECFDRFVEYAKDRYAREHPVYGPQGTFGSFERGYLRDGLRAVARGNVEQSLSIIDHEQRHILQNYMYRPQPAFMPRADFEALGGTPGDEMFRRFMNTLEKVIQYIGNRNGPLTEFSGIRALLSASKLPYMVQMVSLTSPIPMPISGSNTPQPFVFHYNRGDFTNPDQRTPWFKDVVRHFVKAENEDFAWPQSGSHVGYVWRKPGAGGFGDDISPASPPKLKPILYAEIQAVMGAG